MAGFEPWILGLCVEYSTTVLLWHHWLHKVLINLLLLFSLPASVAGFEPLILGKCVEYSTTALLWHNWILKSIINLLLFVSLPAPVTGFEPTVLCLWVVFWVIQWHSWKLSVSLVAKFFNLNFSLQKFSWIKKIYCRHKLAEKQKKFLHCKKQRWYSHKFLRWCCDHS
jgi:hypothetical protein